jgi:hypothetical protein
MKKILLLSLGIFLIILTTEDGIAQSLATGKSIAGCNP